MTIGRSATFLVVELSEHMLVRQLVICVCLSKHSIGECKVISAEVLLLHLHFKDITRLGVLELSEN